MTEHAVRLGPWGSSAGVVTLAEGATGGHPAPAVLFLNAGLLRHAGPHRLHVQLARRLARAGRSSLRFDLSGIGDSGSRQDRLGREESVVRETRDAMDFMERSYGARSFVLFGLCAGADQAVRTALDDERVVGLVLVDGYAYRTRRFQLRHYAARLLRPRSWWNVLSIRHPAFTRMARRLRGPDGAGTSQPPPGARPGVYNRPPRDVAESRLRALVQRGCRLCVAYTPSRHFNGPTQFGEMFPSLAGSDRVRVEYFEHANHLFTLLASQAALIERVEAWMAALRPAPAPPN